MAVLLGDKSAITGGNGRVLESTTQDHVFINFADHGAPGLVAMPIGGYLYEPTLTTTLKAMHTNGMYGELVFYMEACESGSMFKNLPNNINIFATTAANAVESSWAAYCGSDARIDGKNINSCLGDLYSVNWMENTDA